MLVIADFTVIPIGVGTSVSKYIAEVKKIVMASGLNYNMHSCGTNLEGDWDLVMEVIQRCHEAVHTLGATRVHTNFSIESKINQQTSNDRRISSIHNLLNND